jgi:hypothetical protein
MFSEVSDEDWRKPFVMGVLVRTDKNATRMYVHEVVLRGKLQRTSPIKTGADAAEAGMRAGEDAFGAFKV